MTVRARLTQRYSPAAASDRPSTGRALRTVYSTSVLTAVLTMLNVIVTARLLGPTERGQLVFLVSVSSVGSHLAALGVHQAAANFISAAPARSARFAGSALLLSGLLGIAAIVVLVPVLWLAPTAIEGVPWWTIALGLSGLPVSIALLTLQHVAIAHYGFFYNNVGWLMPVVVTVALNLAFTALGILTIALALFAWVAGVVVTLAVLLWAVIAHFGGFDRPTVHTSRQLLGFGVKEHIGRVFTLGNYRLDQWILGAIAGPTSLGTYSVAVAWAEALYFLPSALVVVQRPDLVRASREDARREAARGTRFAIIATIPIAIGLIVLSPFLVTTLFGDEYHASIAQVQVLTLGAFGIIAMKQLCNALTSQRLPLLATAAAAVAFASMVALDIALIPSHGAMGAAVASAITYNIAGVAAVVFFVRHLGGPTRDLVPTLADLRHIREFLRNRAGSGSAAGSSPGSAAGAGPANPAVASTDTTGPAPS